MAVKPVREVSPWSIGGGGQLRELIVLPPVIHIAGHILLLALRHLAVVATIVMFIAGWIEFGSPIAAVFTAVLVPALIWAAKIGLAWRIGEASTLRAVLRGMSRLRSVKKDWSHVMAEIGMTAKGGRVVPHTRNQVLQNGVRMTVVMGAISKNSNALTKKGGDIASGFFCSRALVKKLSPSLAVLTLQWGEHLRQVYRLRDLPEPSGAKRVVFGVSEEGKPAELAYNLSVLAGGLSGSGKSSFAWSVIAGYLAAGIPIRVRVLDPSGVEFAEFKKHKDSPILMDYCSGVDPKPVERFFDRLNADMDRRLAHVEQTGIREHVPTVEEPMDITIIDEILPIASELKKGSTEHPISKVAYLGRKAGFVAIALTQISQVDTLGRARDVFPQRVSFRTQNRYLTDAVLGDNAESDGARCSQLDMEHDRGVGYIASPDVQGYQAFRSAWVSDKETALISQGRLPDTSSLSAVDGLELLPTSVYEMRDRFNALLYVGIAVTGREEERWAEHKLHQWWWPEVADMRTVELLPNRALARTEEARRILKYQPRHNTQHNTDNPNRIVVPSRRENSELAA